MCSGRVFRQEGTLPSALRDVPRALRISDAELASTVPQLSHTQSTGCLDVITQSGKPAEDETPNSAARQFR